MEGRLPRFARGNSSNWAHIAVNYAKNLLNQTFVINTSYLVLFLEDAEELHLHI